MDLLFDVTCRSFTTSTNNMLASKFLILIRVEKSFNMCFFGFDCNHIEQFKRTWWTYHPMWKFLRLVKT